MLIQADWATQKSIIRLSDRKLTGMGLGTAARISAGSRAGDNRSQLQIQRVIIHARRIGFEESGDQLPNGNRLAHDGSGDLSGIAVLLPSWTSKKTLGCKPMAQGSLSWRLFILAYPRSRNTSTTVRSSWTAMRPRRPWAIRTWSHDSTRTDPADASIGRRTGTADDRRYELERVALCSQKVLT